VLNGSFPDETEIGAVDPAELATFVETLDDA
jgi:hypothetical protein